MKDFISCIKSYSTKNLIYTFAEISIMIYHKQLREFRKDSIICSINFPFEALLNGFISKTVEVTLSAWEIQEIAYVSIINANDYRQKEVTEEELGMIVNLYRGYENGKDDIKYLGNASAPDMFKYLMGMTYEQFRFQTLGWSYENFNRNYHILLGSGKIGRDNVMNVNKVTREIFGLEVDELLMMELLIWAICSRYSIPLKAAEGIITKTTSGIITKDNLLKVIQYYSVSYKEVRANQIGKQIFYSKPFVQTEKGNEFIMVNTYLVQMVFADSLYWIMRDYYLIKMGNQDFVNAFGRMFEDYFIELATLYLPRKCWKKIREDKNKGADFYVEFENAIFLFELKSSLLGIQAKQQTPNIEQINTFYKRHIQKAYIQLKSSEESLKIDKPVIKIFLLYELLNNTQVMMLSMPEIFNNKEHNYIMSIQDLEMFLITAKEDNNKISDIIDDMLRNDFVESNSVLKILETHQATDSVHFKEENDYFSTILKKLDEELNGLGFK